MQEVLSAEARELGRAIKMRGFQIGGDRSVADRSHLRIAHLRDTLNTRLAAIAVAVFGASVLPDAWQMMHHGDAEEMKGVEGMGRCGRSLVARVAPDNNGTAGGGRDSCTWDSGQ